MFCTLLECGGETSWPADAVREQTTEDFCFANPRGRAHQLVYSAAAFSNATYVLLLSQASIDGYPILSQGTQSVLIL